MDDSPFGELVPKGTRRHDVTKTMIFELGILVESIECIVGVTSLDAGEIQMNPSFLTLHMSGSKVDSDDRADAYLILDPEKAQQLVAGLQRIFDHL